MIGLISLVDLAPFVIITFLITFATIRSRLVPALTDVLKTYAAIVLSVLGGIRRGMVLNDDKRRNRGRTIVASTLAPFVGWIAIFVTEPMGFAFLIVGYAGQGAWDNITAHNGLEPLWFAKIRLILMVLVITLLAVAFATVVAIARPMAIAFMTTPLLGLLDTAVIGRLGSAAALGGLAVGAILFDIILASFNFLRASTTGLTAQALGRHNEFLPISPAWSLARPMSLYRKLFELKRSCWTSSEWLQ